MQRWPTLGLKIIATIDADMAGKRLIQLDKNKYYQSRNKGLRRSIFPRTRLHPIPIGTVV
jgi:hypothetical protein